ncbi:MAG: SpoIVB peptidase S55 domain-containing protein, partial [Faecalibacillus sp.]
LYDVIIEVNNQKVKSIDDLMKQIENTNDLLDVVVKRNNQNTSLKMKIARKNSEFSTGLYVKDSIKGIGTVTYYNPETGNLACLGHSLQDENNQFLTNGTLYTTFIDNIKKSTKLEVGKKIGSIQEKKIGDVIDNNDYGIYGHYVFDFNKKQLYQTANQDEIKLGEAYFLTVLENNAVTQCKIEIISLEKQNEMKEKGIQFRLTDQDVIAKTGGIIQGMSGSPIIQNNKLIGCVTHASSSNQLEGYGMYIEWMIDKE